MGVGDIIRKHRLHKGMTQGELARAAGISQQAIASLENGTTRSTRFLPEIARVLEKTVEDILSDERLPMVGQLVQDVDFRSLPKDVPVLGQAVGGNNGDFLFNGETIDYFRRPPGLAMAKDVFGLYVAGSSMWPKFEEGEPIYVSGARPPAIGDYVVVELYPKTEGARPEGYIKRLKRRTPTKIVCEQFNPLGEVEYDRESVKAMLRVIPLVELVAI
ncbi:MAG: helix-turn-helix domain-containing protein [Rhizobiaceae bacterium]